jgi:hypothetical protein
MGVTSDRGLLGIAPLHPTYGIPEEKAGGRIEREEKVEEKKKRKKRGRIEYLEVEEKRRKGDVSNIWKKGEKGGEKGSYRISGEARVG